MTDSDGDGARPHHDQQPIPETWRSVVTRRGKSVDAYAIVRRDRLPGLELDPDTGSPPSICGGEFSFSVKEVVMELEVALREVERLNSLAADKPNIRYFWQYTHLFLDGGSFGEDGDDPSG